MPLRRSLSNGGALSPSRRPRLTKAQKSWRCHGWLMMPRARSEVKARVRQHADHNSLVDSVSEEAWREIERTLGMPEPDHELRNQLTEKVLEFGLHYPDIAALKPALLRKWFKSVSANCQKLIDDLAEPEGCDEEAATRMAVLCSTIKWDAREKLLSDIRGLKRFADQKAKTLPRGGGRPADDPSVTDRPSVAPEPMPR